MIINYLRFQRIVNSEFVCKNTRLSNKVKVEVSRAKYEVSGCDHWGRRAQGSWGHTVGWIGDSSHLIWSLTEVEAVLAVDAAIVKVPHDVLVDLVSLHDALGALVMPRQHLASQQDFVQKVSQWWIAVVDQEFTYHSRYALRVTFNLQWAVSDDLVAVEDNYPLVFFKCGVFDPPLLELVDIIHYSLSRNKVTLLYFLVDSSLVRFVGLKVSQTILKILDFKGPHL